MRQRILSWLGILIVVGACGARGGAETAGSGSGWAGTGGSESSGGGSSGDGGGASGGAPGAAGSTNSGNPFAGASFYVNPQWASDVRGAAQAVAAQEPELSAAIQRVASQPSAFWLDRIAAIDGTSTSLGLAGHLDEALTQQASDGGGPMVVAMIVYDLPDRDCAAFASNGELHTNQDGLARYEAEYIDRIVRVIQSKPAYQELRIVAVVEPDALPNIVTNMSLPACAAAEPAYRAGVAYAVKQLATLTNVYIYLDIAHSAWLGWDHPDRAATVYSEVLTAAGGADLVRGFATNVANYSALQEPFNPYDDQGRYNDLI